MPEDSVLKPDSSNATKSHDRMPSPSKLPPGREGVSLFFYIYLKLLKLLRPVYLFLRKRWPNFWQGYLGKEVDLDTSRMLPRFNFLHRVFLGRGFEKISFDRKELDHLKAAFAKGPVIFLMKNWGQVEYNYYNQLFLREKLPLVSHNNLVKMGHWMPRHMFRSMHRQKVDRFFQEKTWPFNNLGFDLTEDLLKKKPALYCLDLPKGSPWVEKNLSAQEEIISQWIEAQEKLKYPIQLVPLHFIYDKHPGKERRSLGDILFGDRENPGYLRKIFLFLRNYKKRAVAKIGEPIDLKNLIAEFPKAGRSDRIKGILRVLQKTYQHEVLQVTGPRLKTRRAMMEEVLENPAMQAKLKEIARAKQLSMETVEKRARKNLKEICSDIRFTLVELWNYFLTWLFNRFFDGVQVDQAGIREIKRAAKDSPIVLVPSHKSHVDYLIFSYVFYHNDLSLPLVCAGNNLSFFPLGPVFRRSGAYFIRRSFAGDPIYAATLKAYVAQLMHDRTFQEFFIEGTRSRSGKLFPPRTGMLKMMVEAYLEDKDIPDVYFIPASIDYERVLEEGAYLDEVQGGKKEKERFWDLLHLPKFLKRRYGKVYLQFAKPISLKAALGDRAREYLENDDALHEFTKNLAWQIGHAINDVTTLLSSALAATALLYPKAKSVTSKEVHAKSETLLKVCKVSDPRISETLEKNFHLSIQEALNKLVASGIIQGHGDPEERFYTFPENQRLALEFYKNRGMHAMADAALCQVCPPDHRAAVKDLLRLEYYFSEPLWEKFTDLPPWLGDLLRPTLEAYWLTLVTTSKEKFKKTEEWLLMRKILDRGKLLLLKGELDYPECLSRFTIQNALTQLTEWGVLQNHVKEMGAKGRKVFSSGPSSGRQEEVRLLLESLLKK